MTIVTGQAIGKKLIEILGLPARTRWFELRVATNELVTIKCGYLPDIKEGAIEEVLAEYELHLKHSAPRGNDSGI